MLRIILTLDFNDEYISEKFIQDNVFYQTMFIWYESYLGLKGSKSSGNGRTQLKKWDYIKNHPYPRNQKNPIVF